MTSSLPWRTRVVLVMNQTRDEDGQVSLESKVIEHRGGDSRSSCEAGSVIRSATEVADSCKQRRC
jgi:hypothetical protein